jgi:hypothetical protein
MHLSKYVYDQMEWSEKTFGPGSREKGIIEHIKKELIEIENAKGSQEKYKEWIDVIILALDGIWRAGLTPEQIEVALARKQIINMQRRWPDWRDGSPDKAIEHDRSYEPGI